MSADKDLKAYIDRVLRLKEEQDALGQDIRDVYAEAKSEGYDKTIMGKLVAHLRKVLKEGDSAVSEQEDIFDTYLQAYRRASGMPVATHTHEEDYDRETGEVFDTPASNGEKAVRPESAASSVGEIAASNQPETANESPRKAAEAGSESDGTAVGRPTSERRPETVGSEEDGVTGGESAATNSPETANGTPSADIRAEGREVGDDVSSVESEDLVPGHQLNDAAASLNEPEDGAIAAVNARDGLADANGVEPSSSAPVADQPLAGGSHVNAPVSAATHQAGGVSVTPATHPLRPNCLNPTSCAGYGSNHCHGCKVAMREGEAA